MFHRLKILLRTSIVGLTLLIAACTPSHSPEESIQLFYESLNQQNYPELLSLFNLEEKLKDPEAEAEAYEILTIIFTDLALNIQEKGELIKLSIIPLNITVKMIGLLSAIPSITMMAIINSIH